MIVEVKFSDRGAAVQGGIEQLSHYMVSTGCSVGLLVTPERMILLRDSLEQADGRSIRVVGEAELPLTLLPDRVSKHQAEYEFQLRIQQWLEKLKERSGAGNLSDQLSELLGEPLINLLRFSEIRVARPRWSESTK